MTPRQRVQAVLHGGQPDRIGFVIWDNKFPAGQLGETLLEQGACVIVKSAVYQARLRTMTSETRQEESAAGPAVRTIYHTPHGDLSSLRVEVPQTSWLRERLFKGPADYGAILDLINDYEYVPCYERFLADDARFGASGLARPATEPTPLLPLMYDILGLEAFAVEWHERRGRVLELYEALLAARRRKLAVVAASPAEFAVVEANVEMSVVGPERFARYYAGPIAEGCRVLHAAGKVAAAHLDARTGALLGPVAGLPLDVIESFTPPPDCDVPLRAALAAWPAKRFIVNFPASLHLRGPAAVRDAARALLAEIPSADRRRILIGVLENVPRQDTLPSLAQTVWELGAL